VKIKFETSLEALKEFYRLQVITRKRHGLPPQPFKFFKAIYENIIAKNLGVIVSAYCSDKIVASAIYFNFNKEAIFKFGASDEKYHHLRPNNLVMWEAIVWHKDKGCHNLNLGRTEQKNEGLLNYKRLWGGKEQLLKYHRYDTTKNSFIVKDPALANFPVLSNRFFPNFLLKIMGNMLYKHFS
jgi:FemAB family.